MLTFFHFTFSSHVWSYVYRRISVTYGWQISRASSPYLDSVTICWIIITDNHIIDRFFNCFPWFRHQIDFMISTVIQRGPICLVDRWTQSTGSKTWRGHSLGRERSQERFYCLFKGNAKLWWTSWEYHTGESTEIMLSYITNLYLSLVSPN